MTIDDIAQPTLQDLWDKYIRALEQAGPNDDRINLPERRTYEVRRQAKKQEIIRHITPLLKRWADQEILAEDAIREAESKNWRFFDGNSVELELEWWGLRQPSGTYSGNLRVTV